MVCYDVPPEWRVTEGYAEEVTTEEDAEFDDAESPEIVEPEPSIFEIQLTGFDGATSDTDHRILWVATDMDADSLEQWLNDRDIPFVMVQKMDFHPTDVAEDIDYNLPEDEQDFVSGVRSC